MDARDSAAELADALIAGSDADAELLDGFLMILRSASSTPGAAVARQQIEQHHLRQLAATLGEDRAALRAALMLSVVAGFQMMRRMIGLAPLVRANRTELHTLLKQVFDVLSAGELPAPTAAARAKGRGRTGKARA
jgi:hypothetical protein